MLLLKILMKQHLYPNVACSVKISILQHRVKLFRTGVLLPKPGLLCQEKWWRPPSGTDRCASRPPEDIHPSGAVGGGQAAHPDGQPIRWIKFGQPQALQWCSYTPPLSPVVTNLWAFTFGLPFKHTSNPWGQQKGGLVEELRLNVNILKIEI